MIYTPLINEATRMYIFSAYKLTTVPVIYGGWGCYAPNKAVNFPNFEENKFTNFIDDYQYVPKLYWFSYIGFW